MSCDNCEVLFLPAEDLDISCRGSYSPEYDVVHLDCDSTRPLTTTQCQLNNGTTIDCKPHCIHFNYSI